MMLGFYKFLIWFFTIVSLLALIYGVLEANIKYIIIFIASLIISVIFYRLDETSSITNDNKIEIKDFSIKGIDQQNEEILVASECLRQEQTKLLADLKSRVYANQDFSNLKQIKSEIIKDFINTLTLKYELTTKQELQDILSGLFNDLERKNINFLFDPKFFPNEPKSYIDWIKRSLVLLGWDIRKVDYPLENFFSGVIERSGLIVGLTISTELRLDKESLKQHEHFIDTGLIDFSVFVTPLLQKNTIEFLISNNNIVIIEHKDLIKLPSKLREPL